MAEKETQKPAQPGEAAKSRKRNILIGGVFLILLAIIGVLLYIIFKPEPPRSNVVTKDNIESAVQDLEQKVKEGMFEITMNTQWTFSDSSSPSSNAYVANSTSNTKPFYFDLVLGDSGEVIYSSPILPVGSKIENLTLEQPLAAGTYSAVVQYHLLDEEGKETSSVGSKVKLTIEN